MKITLRAFLFLSLLVCVSCVSYTKTLTSDNQSGSDRWSGSVEPGKRYKVILNNQKVFIVKVSAINADSLYGTFYFKQGGRMNKMESKVELDSIAEVKGGKIAVIPTLLFVGVPVTTLVILAIESMNNFSLGSGPLF